MRFIFCADPLTLTAPDSMYEAEVNAVVEAGIAYALLDFERLVYERNPSAATRRIQVADPPELAIYRGWMLRPEQYTQLYNTLQAKGLHLINTPAAYRHCHYLPESYPIIRSVTPKTVWLLYEGNLAMDDVIALLTPFGDQPLILKDYVKSRKHEWYEACYIPAANDRAVVERIVHRFVELQGDDLNEGLVFREFAPFQPIGSHTKSGMPLTMEFRCFVLDGRVLTTTVYWEEGAYPDLAPPLHLFDEIIPQVQSRFFTMDIAQRTDGMWMIVELGDGQVAGLPEQLDPASFYRTLIERIQQADTTDRTAS